MPNSEIPISNPPRGEAASEAVLRERQDELVRILAVENNAGVLAQVSDELEAVQRSLEEIRSGKA